MCSASTVAIPSQQSPPCCWCPHSISVQPSINRSRTSPMPKVLIADKLSPAAVAIFRERGVDADVKTGLTKEELIKIVDQYDGIAIRSATKLTADVLKAAKNLKVIRSEEHTSELQSPYVISYAV